MRKLKGNNRLGLSAALSVVLLVILSLDAQAFLLPATGQTLCYDGNVIAAGLMWQQGESGTMTMTWDSAQGTLATLMAGPNSGWLFADGDDKVASYKQSSGTITMDANKPITVNFAMDSKISLASIDASPLDKRTPLILVHGNRMETETQFGWSSYVIASGKDSVFQERYKIYLFAWDSEQSNAYNGQALGIMVDRLPELAYTDLTILAHSRGGIIARYFMNHYVMQSGNHEGQPGGEKVKWLVTLATPHRGSPGADPIWVDVSFDYNFLFPVKLALEDLYFVELPQIDYHGLWDPKTLPYLLWDDVDKELTLKAVCYYPAFSTTPATGFMEVEQCTPLMSKTSLNNLSEFNKNERYLNKIIAYGGNNYTQSLYYRIMLNITGFLSQLSTDKLNWSSMSKYVSEHQLLDLSTFLMELMPIIPPGYDRVPDNPQRPFKANDGLVPLASALFLKHDASSLFQFNENNFSYNKRLLNNFFCQIAECNVIDGTIDHLGFLDNSQIISTVLSKLNSLRSAGTEQDAGVKNFLLPDFIECLN